MDGWCSVEELTQWGFAHAPVLMANEAHSGLQRCVRTRQVGARVVQAAHPVGMRRLAMEALPWRPATSRARFGRFRRPVAGTWTSRTCAR
jgi:hypothetical protein